MSVTKAVRPFQEKQPILKRLTESFCWREDFIDPLPKKKNLDNLNEDLAWGGIRKVENP